MFKSVKGEMKGVACRCDEGKRDGCKRDVWGDEGVCGYQVSYMEREEIISV